MRMHTHQLVEFGKPLVSTMVDVPEPAAGEVVVKLLACGVCHSDLHLCEGKYDLGGGQQMSMEGRFPLPITPGHEMAGEVAAVGAGVTEVAIGDRVLVSAWAGCRECAPCLEGNEQFCAAPHYAGVFRPGGYAEYVLAEDVRYLIPLGDIDPVAAVPLGCSGLTTYSALKRFGDRPRNEPVVIIGAGGLGLFALGVLKLIEGKGAVVVEIDPAKRAAALEHGAIAAIDPRAPDAIEALRAAVGGPVRNVLDLVGSGETVALGFTVLDKGGKLVVVGLFGGSANLSVTLFPLKSAAIEGSYIGPHSDLAELVALVREKGLPDFPIDRRPLSTAGQALADLGAGRVIGRIVLTPDADREVGA